VPPRAFSALELMAALEHSGPYDNLGSEQATSPFLDGAQHAETCGRSNQMERYQYCKALNSSKHCTHIDRGTDIDRECTQGGRVTHISDRLPIALAAE
jgi:hypothetical protein